MIWQREGVKRSLKAIEDADLVIAVVDGSEPLKNEDFEVLGKIKGKNAIIAINKSDLISPKERESRRAEVASALFSYASQIISISALKEDGLEELKDTIFSSCVKNWKEQKEGIIITNLRHKIAIQAAYDSLGNALKSMETNQPVEITAIDLREALDRIGEIVGAVTTDDILNRIFSDFCIGK